MAKRIECGAKTVGGGKYIIGLNVPEKLKNKIEQAATELGITRQAFIILAVNHALGKKGIAFYDSDSTSGKQE